MEYIQHGKYGDYVKRPDNPGVLEMVKGIAVHLADSTAQLRVHYGRLKYQTQAAHEAELADMAAVLTDAYFISHRINQGNGLRGGALRSYLKAIDTVPIVGDCERAGGKLEVELSMADWRALLCAASLFVHDVYTTITNWYARPAPKAWEEIHKHMMATWARHDRFMQSEDRGTNIYWRAISAAGYYI